MSNAGLKLREPVIGDQFDMDTYGRPAGRSERAQREQRPAPGAARARRVSTHRPRPSEQPRAARRAESPLYADGVRTVKIKGQATPPRRRPSAQIVRYDQRPDRAAQWALFMGVFMVVVAIVTGT